MSGQCSAEKNEPTVRFIHFPEVNTVPTVSFTYFFRKYIACLLSFWRFMRLLYTITIKITPAIILNNRYHKIPG